MKREPSQIVQQARKEGKWIYAVIDPDVWWSPDELEMMQAKGKYCWHTRDFGLAHPLDHIHRLEYQIVEARKARDAFLERIEAWQKSEQE